MMSDRPTTGGYPKLATLARAVLPLLAQCQAGQDTVRFRAVSVEAAQTEYRRLMSLLEEGMVYGED
jgi:allophanate hydrolase subunit 2